MLDFPVEHQVFFWNGADLYNADKNLSPIDILRIICLAYLEAPHRLLNLRLVPHRRHLCSVTWSTFSRDTRVIPPRNLAALLNLRCLDPLADSCPPNRLDPCFSREASRHLADTPSGSLGERTAKITREILFAAHPAFSAFFFCQILAMESSKWCWKGLCVLLLSRAEKGYGWRWRRRGENMASNL